jgi:serine/threonine protein kinase
LKELSLCACQLISQLEIIHKLGYTHGDLKFQNICFDREKQQYTIIDFALVTKIFYKNGQHKAQEKVKSFYGNSLFASDSMVNLLTTSRKDDLESLMYILCYLYKGVLPIIEFINMNIDNFHMSRFLSRVLKYRQEKKEQCHERIKSLLPMSMSNAFQYIINMAHEDKPNYGLLKIFCCFDEDDEKVALDSKIKITNHRLA